MENASNITVRGITFEATRDNGIVIKGGANNLIYNCTVRLLSKIGIVIDGGENHGVVSCEVYDTGEGGIYVSGGDRQTLTPAGHYAENNHVYRVDRIKKTYSDCINISGVGNRASYNEIHDALHEVMGFRGNDNLIEFNYIHDALKETQDAGAIYAGRDWTMRGNVIKNNFIMNTTSDLAGVNPKFVKAIYLDDQFSSADIIGNVFYNVMTGVFINGGRDNSVKGNIFIKVNPNANPIELSTWGLTPEAMKNMGVTTPNGSVPEEKRATLGLGIKDVPYNKEPYTKYPHLSKILDDEPCQPKYNIITGNVYYDSQQVEGIRINGAGNEAEVRERNTINGNVSFTKDPGFVDAKNLNFALKDDSEVYSAVKGFEKIPFERIGLYTNKLKEKMKNSLALFVGSPIAIVNNVEKFIDETNFDVVPVVKDGRTLVPVRFIAESLNAKVEWNQAASEVTVNMPDKTIKMNLGSNVIDVNGVKTTIDVPAQIINGRTLLPLRAVVEIVGKKVYWDGRGLIYISDNENPFNPQTEKNYLDEIIRMIR